MEEATHHYDQSPELVPESHLEVVPHEYYQTSSSPQTFFDATPKTEGTGAFPVYHTQADPSVYTASQTPATPYSMPLGPAPPSAAPVRRATICGCTLLVFVLSAIVATLGAAVIGLAAGVGIEANRVATANDQLASASAALAVAASRTVIVTAAAPTATGYSGIDNDCSGDPDNVSGQSYTAFSLLGGESFTMHCNKDTLNNPVLSLFVADFNSCMDSCSSYNKYIPVDFSGLSNSTNATCGAVSFIPLWTQKSRAASGSAPGNCYLKPAPSGLKDAYIGTECHSAMLVKR